MRHKHPWVHELQLTGWLGWAVLAWGLLAFTFVIGVLALGIFHEPPTD